MKSREPSEYIAIDVSLSETLRRLLIQGAPHY